MQIQRYQKWFWLAPVLLALLANFNVTQNGFGWDDEVIIQGLRAPDHWWRLILPDFSVRQDAPYYRPVVELSYMLDYAVWGVRPFGFHLSLLIAHLINTALVFFLAQGLTAVGQALGPAAAIGQTRGAAPTHPGEHKVRPYNFLPLLAASLFAVYPVHAEAVAWIAGRSDVFCTTFLLASLILYLRFLQSGSRNLYGAAMVAFGFALLTKETAAGLLLIFPLADLLAAPKPSDRPRRNRPAEQSTARRIALRLLLPLAVFALYYLYRQAIITRPLGDYSPGRIFTESSIPRIVGAMGLYLKTLLFPYPHRPFIAAIPAGFADLLFYGLPLIGAAAAGWFALRRKDALLLIAGAWTFALLAPALAVATLLIASTPAAERYLYAPSAGFSIFAAAFGLLGLRRLTAALPDSARPARLAAAGLAIAILAIGGVSNYARNPAWKSPFTFWETVVGTSPDAGLPYRELGMRYADRKEPERAEQLYRKAIELDEKKYGPGHPETGASLHNLASLYHDRGRYAEAEALYQRAIVIWEKALDPASPDLATGVNNLAGLYFAEGKLDQAVSLYQRSLSTWEKVRGPDHPDVAQSLNNLATVYKAQNRYSDAEAAYRRALSIREKILPPDHPDRVASLNRLAGIYYNQRNFDRAEPLYQQALAIREKTLGPNHADVAQSLNFLAALYYARNEQAKAEPLYQRALEIREKALGPDHPDTAQSLNNLAVLYHAQGRYDKAESLLRRSLSIREKALGSDHPDMATALNNLAGLYFLEGKYAEAEPLFKRAVAIREKALKPDRSDLAASLENYGALLRKMKREPEAAALAARAKAIREKLAR